MSARLANANRVTYFLQSLTDCEVTNQDVGNPNNVGIYHLPKSL